MKIEILYFDGCPTYSEAEKTLRKVLAQEGAEAEVELLAVETDEEARLLRFPGSPTIRVDGHDLFPSSAAEREDRGLGCRVYATPGGPKGSPTAGMLKEALTTREGRPMPAPFIFKDEVRGLLEEGTQARRSSRWR
jgi:hypothetical protein